MSTLMILSPLGVLTAALAITGSFTDLKARVIPNWLTAGALLLALLLRTLMGESLVDGLTGAGLAFLVGLAFYVIRVIGAGDVKYLTAFGAIIGAGRIWPALLFITLAGGALALLWSMAMGRSTVLIRDAAYLGIYCITLGLYGSRRILSEESDLGALTPIPFGVAIAVGCTLVWFL